MLYTSNASIYFMHRIYRKFINIFALFCTVWPDCSDITVCGFGTMSLGPVKDGAGWRKCAGERVFGKKEGWNG